MFGERNIGLKLLKNIGRYGFLSEADGLFFSDLGLVRPSLFSYLCEYFYPNAKAFFSNDNNGQ